MNQVHIAGVGDYSLAGMTGLADPCPLPSAAKKKGLREKEKLFYAPMSGLGDLLYDKDAVYININDHLVQFSKVDDEKGGVARKGFCLFLHSCGLCLISVKSLFSFVCSTDEVLNDIRQLAKFSAFLDSAVIISTALSVCVCDVTGRDRDVGEFLVKSLQNTQYSIDEKLEKSFISLFGRKPNTSSGAQDGAKGDLETVEEVCEIEPSERYQSEEEIESDESGEENDGHDRDGMEASDQDQAVQRDHLREHVEYNSGRLRRKAFFGNDVDHGDLRVNDGGNH